MALNSVQWIKLYLNAWIFEWYVRKHKYIWIRFWWWKRNCDACYAATESIHVLEHRCCYLCFGFGMCTSVNPSCVIQCYSLCTKPPSRPAESEIVLILLVFTGIGGKDGAHRQNKHDSSLYHFHYHHRYIASFLHHFFIIALVLYKAIIMIIVIITCVRCDDYDDKS